MKKSRVPTVHCEYAKAGKSLPQLLEESFQQAALAAECFVKEGVEAAMCKYNTKKKKKPKQEPAAEEAAEGGEKTGE